MKKLFLLAGLLAVIGFGCLRFMPSLQPARAATIACSVSNPCASPDTCYYSGTNQSYCALPIGGSSSCSYGCCSNVDCAIGKNCYNPGTPLAYCAVPATSPTR